MNNYLDSFVNAFLGSVDWTWKSIIWELSFKYIVELRDRLEAVIGSYLHKYVYPDYYQNHLDNGQTLKTHRANIMNESSQTYASAINRLREHINGRLIGTGELVEIEGSLGVRVTELLAKRSNDRA